MSNEQSAPESPADGRKTRKSSGFPAGLWALVLAAALAGAMALAMWLRPAPELPVYGTLPEMSLRDQEGAAFGRDRLTGHPTVVNFFFTTCPTICPLLTRRMHRVQELTAGSTVRLVSISVDPDNDTPAALKAYGTTHGADFKRWTFVTGAREAVDLAVVQGFKTVLDREKPKQPADPSIWDIVHGERFVLVDGQGRLRGYYPADDAALQQLSNDARRLADARE